jgi:hypothetical protein
MTNVAAHFGMIAVVLGAALAFLSFNAYRARR